MWGSSDYKLATICNIFKVSPGTVAHEDRSKCKRDLVGRARAAHTAIWKERAGSLHVLAPFLLWNLTRVSDQGLLPWFAVVGTSTSFNGIHIIHSLNHPAQDNMLPVQPTSLPLQDLHDLELITGET
jgi:hypothetical protein